LNQPPNPDLRWEKTGIINLGLDFAILKRRIAGSIDWFRKKSTDVIAPYPVDPTLGITSSNLVYKNVADLNTRGFDINITSNNLVGNFSWSTTFNFSYAKTVVSKYFQNQLAGIPSAGGINPVEGKVAYGLYTYRWAGLDALTGDPQGYLNKQVSKDYLAIINDSISNQHLSGSAIPLQFGNFMNTFSWNNLSLSVNISYRLSYYFMRSALNYGGLFNWGLSGSGDYKKRWQKPGDEKTTTVPSLSYPPNTYRDIFYAGSEVNAEKGDHIRLQDIRLQYNWVSPKKHKLPFTSIQFYLFTGNLNVFLWKSTKSGYDPDLSQMAIPQSKSWSLGSNLNF
jgi:hypothetical protein